MMIALLTDVVLTLTGFQLLLLAAVLVLQLPARSLRRNLLAAFLLTKAFLILRWFALRFDIVDATTVPTFYLVSSVGFFLLAPLLYVYVRALCYRDFSLRWRHLLHLLPAAAVAAFAGMASAVAFSGASLGNSAADRFANQHFWDLFWAANLLQIALYVVAMFRVVGGYRRRLADLHASPGSIDLRWLEALLVLISLHWAFVVSRAALGLFDLSAPTLTAGLDLFSITIFLVFTTVLVVKGLSHVKLFPGIEERAPGCGQIPDSAQLAVWRTRVLGCMRFEKPYLESSLSVDELASRLAIPAWQLSRVLNIAFEQNFFTFVNSYRVEEAKRQLGNPANNHKTMLQIMHESGFNSKSTFNEVFKRHEQMTPSEYRRRAQDEPVSVAVSAP